jgi:hypothetical protein
MTKNIVAVVVLSAVSAAAFLAGARKVQAAPAPGAPLEFIGGDRDTSVYYFKHEGRSCYVATTRGGSGISLQCVK